MADLNLRVKVAVDGANKLDSLSGKMSTVGKNLTIGLTAPIIAAGAGFITMAADAEKSQSKLESVFESTEAAAWTSVDALDAHATALSKATTFDDESIKEAQAALLKFGT